MKSLNEMIGDIVERCNKLLSSTLNIKNDCKNTKEDACNRLKLVLMHDRSKIAPETLEQMRDELVEVISKYVEIDKEALNLNLASEGNSIALVASIPVRGQKELSESDSQEETEDSKETETCEGEVEETIV